jgi:hypothetical protein
LFRFRLALSNVFDYVTQRLKISKTCPFQREEEELIVNCLDSCQGLENKEMLEQAIVESQLGAC